MFTLAVVDDTVKVAASQMNVNNIIGALTHNINAKYANRVLANVGLCVAHFDYVDVSEGHIRHGDGGTYYKTTFRLVVFRPFVGEVLLGKVKSFDEYGIRITLGFFDDIHVSWDGMPQPSAYDVSEAAWFWVWTDAQDLQGGVNGTGGGGGTIDGSRHDEDEATAAVFQDPFSSEKAERFYFLKDELVRFVVESDQFNEPEPPGPEAWKAAQQGNSSGRGGGGGVSGPTGSNGVDEATIREMDSGKRIAPYKIKASMATPGTGMVSWWTNSEAQTPEE